VISTDRSLRSLLDHLKLLDHLSPLGNEPERARVAGSPPTAPMTLSVPGGLIGLQGRFKGATLTTDLEQ
jgi:hypothetical protein